jgi:hypothetical protein
MEKLIAELNNYMAKLESKENLTEESPGGLGSVYPFNRFEYRISRLLSEQVMTFEDYCTLRREYLERNKYLSVFEITAPRTFGENWAQEHLYKLVPELQRPSKNLDPDYSGQYDFWFNGIRIEVKASRAVKRSSGGSLISKALSSDSPDRFDMNFQQIKPGCCDVFVWIAVWRDIIRYWVLSSDEVKGNPYFSAGQHRGNTGEGQLWLKESNIAAFNRYLAQPEEILGKIIEKAKK